MVVFAIGAVSVWICRVLKQFNSSFAQCLLFGTLLVALSFQVVLDTACIRLEKVSRTRLSCQLSQLQAWRDLRYFPQVEWLISLLWILTYHRVLKADRDTRLFRCICLHCELSTLQVCDRCRVSVRALSNNFGNVIQFDLRLRAEHFESRRDGCGHVNLWGCLF